MSEPEIAQRATLSKYGLFVDGKPFPYYIGEDIEVHTDPPDDFTRVVVELIVVGPVRVSY